MKAHVPCELECSLSLCEGRNGSKRDDGLLVDELPLYPSAELLHRVGGEMALLSSDSPISGVLLVLGVPRERCTSQRHSLGSNGNIQSSERMLQNMKSYESKRVVFLIENPSDELLNDRFFKDKYSGTLDRYFFTDEDKVIRMRF